MITQPISQLKGLDRVCSIGQIAYLDFDIQEAKIRFDVTITDLNIKKSYWSHINNGNKVTAQGVMITKEYADSTFVEPEKLQEDQTIEQLKEQHYQDLMATGIPEFTFWWELSKQVKLEESLHQGIALLDSFNFFN